MEKSVNQVIKRQKPREELYMKSLMKSAVSSVCGCSILFLNTLSCFASESSIVADKAMPAAIVIGIAAAAGAISMGWAISKASEGVSRQPEASGKIQTILMLGLVFIETAIIYALIVAILIIFVL